MQHSVTSDAPVSSSRCGYRARVSLQAAWIFVSFVLLPLPVSVACVCRCCGNCAVLLAARPAAPQPPSVGFFFLRVCQGHAALRRVVSVAKLTSVSHLQLLPSRLVYLRARFPACPAPPGNKRPAAGCRCCCRCWWWWWWWGFRAFCVCATVKPLH